MGITHFAVGAVGGILVNQKLKGDRLVVPLISGVFAMLADADQLTNDYLLENVVNSGINNIFWFHGILDTYETPYPEIEGMLALSVLIAVAWYTSDF